MKLLLDQNLPRSLLERLPTSLSDSKHVVDVGLDASSDQAIFAFARDNAYTILSKDSDFRQLSFLYGAPPKVIWIRIGNSTVADLIRCFNANLGVIEQFESAAESFLVIEPDSTE